MVLPSGEKATERTAPLCALCFSALSSREAVANVGALRFGIGEGSGAGLGAPASQTLIGFGGFGGCQCCHTCMRRQPSIVERHACEHRTS